MRAVAVIPWRGGDPHREQALDYVTRYLTAASVEWATHDSGGAGPFNRAHAKNHGALEAFGADADVVIFHDADMVLHEDSYQTLTEAARSNDRLVIGYTEYRALSRQGTKMVLRGRITPWQASVAGTTVGWSLGGIIAVNMQSYFRVGGYDMRFRGWGCEDFAFAIACRTVLGEHIRLPGPSCHLWHEHGKATQAEDDERWNAQLLGRYNAVTGVEDLRSVQREEP